jgi:hypothetical protein
LKPDLARVVAAAVATLTLVGAAAWGCATESNSPVREHDWQHREPDGGWQNFEPRPYDVDPARSALGPTVPYMPTTVPLDPAMPAIR